jgi:four helix bundle protein
MLKFKIQAFEKLIVWQTARKLVVKVYRITSSFPDEEKYGLKSQMRRAVISISNNLAEGTSRYSFYDQARFTEISFGSLAELINDTIHSFDLGFLEETDYIDLRIDYDNIGPMIDGLRKSQIKRSETEKFRKTN